MAKGPYVARGNQRVRVARSKTYNIDNGAGQTDDDIIFGNLLKGITIVKAQLIYTEATDTTGAASANVKLGTTAGGTEIVGSTNLTAATAVGGTQALTLALARVNAGSNLYARHTGVATTEVGQYFVQVEYISDP